MFHILVNIKTNLHNPALLFRSDQVRDILVALVKPKQASLPYVSDQTRASIVYKIWLG